jgi:EAL domain-containing protein (putative c-di-GMP-specific phosphodiesterase class I)
VIKLDRRAVTNLDKDRRKQAIVKATVSMCADLGAQLVAEGVETEGELETLIACGVTYAQGYLLARPEPVLPPVNWPPTMPRANSGTGRLGRTGPPSSDLP